MGCPRTVPVHDDKSWGAPVGVTDIPLSRHLRGTGHMSMTAKFGPAVPVPLWLKPTLGEFFSLSDVMGGNLPVRPSSLAAGTQAVSQPQTHGSSRVSRLCVAALLMKCVCGDHTDACLLQRNFVPSFAAYKFRNKITRSVADVPAKNIYDLTAPCIINLSPPQQLNFLHFLGCPKPIINYF